MAIETRRDFSAKKKNFWLISIQQYWQMTLWEIFRVYFVEVFSENNKGRIARDN